MAMLPLEPFGELRRLQRQMDNVFSDFEREVTTTTPGSRMWAPKVDVKECNGQLCVHAELPGVPKDKINVQLENGILTLSGEREVEKKDETSKWYRVERSYGSFMRSFNVGENVKPEDIKANYKDGVLELTMPAITGKEQQKRAKRIDIK